MSRTQKDALVSAQPIGRIIRRNQLAVLANHSTDWVDRQARQKDPVLVAVRNSNGRVMGFTEASVRRLLMCEALAPEEKRLEAIDRKREAACLRKQDAAYERTMRKRDNAPEVQHRKREAALEKRMERKMNGGCGMNAAALNIVRSALSAAAAHAPAITEERTKNALLVLEGQVAAADPNAVQFPIVMTAEEVADVMRISVRSVRSYAQRGKIRRAYYSDDRRKAAGYVGASVRAFVESVICDESEQTPPPEVEVEIVEN